MTIRTPETPCHRTGCFPAIVLAVLLFPAMGRAQDSQPSARHSLEIEPVTMHPCLLFGPEDVPDIKRRFFEALPVHPPANPRKMNGAMYGLLYGDEAFRKTYTERFMTDVRARFTVKPGGEYQGYRRYNEMMVFYDVVASFGYLSEADKRDFRDLMTAGAVHYIGEPPVKKGETEGFHNRSVDQATVGVLAGLSFPDHPMARDWVTFGIELYRGSLDRMVFEGAWSEVPRYHNWSLLLFSGAFQALSRRTGTDFFQDTRVKALLDWYVRFSSPLVRFPNLVTPLTPNGEPTTPVWGDSNYGPMFQVCAMFAPKYAETDPAFARRLMWMWRRAGSPYQGGWHFDVVFPALVDPLLPDEPQVLGSAFCRTFGYTLLRSGFDTPDETVVYVRGGRRGGLHPRADLGSIDLFSHGIPLALGSQSGPYRDPEIQWNRSQRSNNCVVFGDKPRDRTECSGTVDAFFSSPQVDYAVADCSRPAGGAVAPEASFRWRRHLLLVKHPDYLIVWDEIASLMSSEYFLHTTAEKLLWEPHGIVSHTAYAADLDIHVLSPAAPLVPNEKEGPFGSWLYDNPKKGKSDPYPFTHLRYIVIPAQPGEDFLTVLHPKRPDDDAMKATLISATANGVELQVEVAGRTDTVVLGKHGGRFQRNGTAVVDLPMNVEGNAESGARFLPE